MTGQRAQREPKCTTVVDVENIGGIEQTTVEFSPGPTVLSGRNATNRSSFLRSIMAAMGSDLPALKADAEEGRVELSIGDDTYMRTYKRTDHGVVTGGNPYLGDATDADLFAFLLGDNEARRAVENGDDLREVMLRPVDTDQIESEINRMQAERDEIDRQLEEIESLRDSREALQAERVRVEQQIDRTQEEFDEIDVPDIHIDENLEKERDLESLLETLRDERSTLENTSFELTTERESVEALQDEELSIEDALEELPDVSEERIEHLEERIDTLREERSALEMEISQLGTVGEFNEEMINGHADLLDEHGSSSHDVTDALLEDEETVTCWTCGTDVDLGAIRTTLEHLRKRRQEKVEQHSEVSEELRSAREEEVEINQQRSNRKQLDAELDAVREEITRRTERIESLESEQKLQEQRVEDLEEAVAELEREDYDELLDVHRRANELEFEINRLEDEKERIESNIEELDARLNDQEELEHRREAIGEELVDLRTRVERIEEEAVSAFNAHMEELLDILAYENIDRVWIERRSESVRNGGGSGERTIFDHHVVRSANDGTIYEDSVDHLSESEREVIGLVFALAGYLVHELHEEVPFVLLDSLEVIDSNRIATIVEYFDEYAESLVVALLPEDAAALDGNVEVITDLASS